MRQGGRIRVMIADDTHEIRESLADLVRSDPSLELVGTARDAQEAVELVRTGRPDVALLDVKMPAGGGPRAAREIRDRYPGTRTVALSAYEDRTSVFEMLQAGACGYVVKGIPNQVLETIYRTADGQATLSDQVARHVVTELSTNLQREAAERDVRMARTSQIRRILSQDLIRIVLQPIVHLGSGTMSGAEALARFDLPPDRPPDLWFREAESVGLAAELETAAVRAALAALPLLPPDAYLSINVSPGAVLVPAIQRMIGEEVGRRVVLEMTEHIGIQDYDGVNAALMAFRERGVRIAIDDAGAGFASLRHILRLAPEVIKLDISLIQHIDADPVRRALARSLMAFAEEIGAAVVAEGIETPEQLATLRALGASHGQGYVLSCPTEIAAWPPAIGTGTPWWTAAG
jgi:EAL domain-containing protein (putative c-di-GMP-specific phosphodiesterase class I)